jgi:1-deoxy-D-xylulose 5-phosphate reductoisomerase
MTVTLARSKPAPAFGQRRITILGATGSIGASTIDLIKREPERYRVEAVTARKSATALASLARELNAKVAVSPTTVPIASSKMPWPAAILRRRQARRRCTKPASGPRIG